MTKSLCFAVVVVCVGLCTAWPSFPFETSLLGSTANNNNNNNVNGGCVKDQGTWCESVTSAECEASNVLKQVCCVTCQKLITGLNGNTVVIAKDGNDDDKKQKEVEVWDGCAGVQSANSWCATVKTSDCSSHAIATQCPVTCKSCDLAAAELALRVEEVWDEIIEDGSRKFKNRATGKVQTRVPAMFVPFEMKSNEQQQQQQPTLFPSQSLHLEKLLEAKLKSNIAAEKNESTLPLLEGWKEITDPETGRIFYSNPSVGAISWKRPTDHSDRQNLAAAKKITLPDPVVMAIPKASKTATAAVSGTVAKSIVENSNSTSTVVAK
eukprot:c2972_g1_i1.p1 GENE.c2972_g1_i1~~c2972_g1_i1.p1  ORF type:complete len:337 (+),score=130.07 c2972_g1_i1:45-1013(+)